MAASFRVGDVLRLSCPYTPATVAGTSPDHISVRWPWWAVDPESDWIRWNGDVALVRSAASPEWADELFRTVPPAEGLRPGEHCRVGIPPTLVHVMAVHRFDPPLETGRLPRPRTHVVVLPAGRSQDPMREEQGYEIDPDDDIPIRIELVFRPYAFLQSGDELVDRNERAWSFHGPWDWYAFDGGAPGTPAWPLTLLARDGTADPDAAAVIGRATADGSHAQELDRWKALTGAEPAPAR
ncbi:hypothetical protein [Micromonospora auratinigra]|nr:hypothetical protein [Micromonospora auratinigra]